jgi:hypothetical protein
MEENRMTGKTTRTIDHAIQVLFTEGIIEVPTNKQIERLNSESKNRNTLILDPDWKSHSAVQTNLLRGIMRRLKFEHKMEYNKSFKVNGTTIFIDDPKFVKNGVQ